jgi:hypothetical protein
MITQRFPFSSKDEILIKVNKRVSLKNLKNLRSKVLSDELRKK